MPRATQRDINANVAFVARAIKRGTETPEGMSRATCRELLRYLAAVGFDGRDQTPDEILREVGLR